MAVTGITIKDMGQEKDLLNIWDRQNDLSIAYGYTL
jgi:hypothetical protein